MLKAAQRACALAESVPAEVSIFWLGHVSASLAEHALDSRVALDRLAHNKIHRDADAARAHDRRAAARREVAANRLVEEATTVEDVLLLRVDEIANTFDSSLANPVHIEVICVATTFHRRLIHDPYFWIGQERNQLEGVTRRALLAAALIAEASAS